MDSDFRALDNALQDEASHRVEFERDESDSFSLDIVRLTSEPSAVDVPSKRDVLPLLPRGSNWSQAEGWRSFFGVPFRFEETLLLALGLVKIRSHDSRGAYPLSRIFLTEFKPERISNCLEQLLGSLDTDVDSGTENRPRYGAIMGEAQNPGEHLETEKRILRSAGKSYGQGKRLLFRTAILSENEIPPFSFLNFFGGQDNSEEVPFDHGPLLYGTVPDIFRSFSWSTKLKVYLEFDLSL